MAEIMVRFDDLRRYCEKRHCGSVPLEYIKQMPTIEAEPVRRGRWIRRETVLDTECKCSVCGYKDFVPKHDNYWFRRKFCPNCGADMREAIEDATDN